MFASKRSLPDQLALLDPLLRAWCGGDPSPWTRSLEGRCVDWTYRPEKDFVIGIQRNSAHGKSPHDSDRFPDQLSCVDLQGRLAPEEHRARILAVLELLWSHGIPACSVSPWNEELPYAGGEEGPLPWPA